MRRNAAALLAALVLLFAPAAGARVFPGITWGAGGDALDPRRLDMHTPAAPGPHPMVVLAGIEDADALARDVAGRGHVVAVLASGTAGTPAALAEALAFVYWRAGGYGGDARRMHVAAGGAAATALLALGADPAPLRVAGMPGEALHAVALVGWRGPAMLPAAVGDAVPPALMVVAPAADAARMREAASLAEQWRARGAQAEWVTAAPGPGAGEDVGGVLLRWLDLAALLRAPRFEALRFGRAAEGLPDGVHAAALAVEGASLLLAADGAATSVWRLDAPAGTWRREWSGAGGRVLWFDAPAQGQAPLLLVERDGHWVLHRRAGGRWDGGRGIGRTSTPAAGAWLLAIDEPGAAAPALLVALDAGADSRLLRLRADGAAGVESLPAIDRITGLAAYEGVPMLALHGPRGGRLLRRVDGPTGVWITAAAWDSARGALHGLASLLPDEPGLAGVLAGGQAVRIDPARGEVRVEADLAGALARQWGTGITALAPRSNSAVTLRHPHTGDRVQLLGLGVSDPREPPRRGWFVVRQVGGHYAYGRAGDPQSGAGAPLRRLLASPFGVDGGAVYYALEDGEPPTLRRARLAAPAIPAGAWADRAVAGRGVVLERTRGGWIALLYHQDADGSPRWYSAGGSVQSDAFVAATGLVRHRRDPDGRLAAEPGGTLSIRFGVDASDPACAGVPRPGARALAVLAVRIADAAWVDCIEPLRPADAARPVTDGSGLWMAPDGAWGIALQSTGAGPEGDERALVFHFDRHGGPRWLWGEGTRRVGEAVIVLEYGNAEGRLTYAFRGACGAVAGSASLVLPTVGTEPAQVFPATALLNAGGGACY